MTPRTIVWFSCGAASAVCGKLMKAEGRENVEHAYCETGAEHPDNKRFLRDYEEWCGIKVRRLKSEKYADTWSLWEGERYLAGINGAPCTRELKVRPRLRYQRPSDIHVFGYTADAADVARAEALREHYPELTIETPLIDRGIKKEACLEIIRAAGISLPILYGLGFPNNNCIPCVKATSPAYWALVRLHFPEEFWRMANLSRALGVRLCRIKGERCFIDEIPEDQPVVEPIMPACDFLCAIAMEDLK